MITVNRVAEEYFDSFNSTSGNNTNKYFQWVNDGSGEFTFYIDRKINQLFSDVSSGRKYVWLLESRSIIPDVYEWVEFNSDILLNFCDGILTHDINLSKKNGFFYVKTNAASWILNTSKPDKTKLVSMISSNKAFTEGHRNRLKYVDKFKNQLDFYGRGFRDISLKEDGLRDYMFSVAIENANYDRYFTEKITDCFATRTIPIFYGTEGVCEYFNKEGIIFLDENFDLNSLSEEFYLSKSKVIEENYQLALNFGTAEDYIAKFILGKK
jgi:hypothetical protein